MTDPIASRLDLVAFLRAWLDETEQRAREDNDLAPVWTAHILADVETKRRILNLHPAYWYTDEEPGFGMWLMECPCRRDGTWCPTLLALAAPLADHPDFDPVWRLP